MVKKQRPTATSRTGPSQKARQLRGRDASGSAEERRRLDSDGPAPATLDLPGQWPPVDRAYLRPVVGRKARPSRKAGAPPLPTFYPKTSGNYLLELTAFHGGADGR
jgi:hypothetical protein